VLRPLAGRDVLVTGAAGFVGARVARLAADAGARVRALVRPGTQPSRLPDGVTAVEADLRDFQQVRQALEAARPQLLVHAAALVDPRQDPALTLPMMEVNAIGTAHLLEAARQVAARRLVALGSVSEYGDAPDPLREDGPQRPLDPYAASKLAATELALTFHRRLGLPTTVVRPFVLYGPGEPTKRLFPSLFAAALAGGGPAAFTPGEQVRDFVYVDDVVEGVLRALVSEPAAGQIINLGTGVGTSVQQAVRLAVQVSGDQVQPQFGALPYRPGEPPRMVASTETCAALLGWTPPTSLEQGLKAYWRASTMRPLEPR
jgi:nucleoside-diphosphate-sugar epimerase